MEITFDKRIYNIQDGDNLYEVTHVVKHPNEAYNNDYYNVLIYREYPEPDMLNMSGFWYMEPSAELMDKIKEIVTKYEQSR